MQTRYILKEATEKLAVRHVSLPFLEARMILAHAFEKSQEYLLLNFDQEVSEKIHTVFAELLARRIKGEPMAYILGIKEFYGRDFAVNRHVLIPRPDTEILIDSIINELDNNKEYRILDLGTGSGAIAVTLAAELPLASIVASDISAEALLVSKENALKNMVLQRIEFVQSDWYTQIELPEEDDKYDVIVSNPPYIAKEEMSVMASETLEYEPHIALFAESSTLAAYEEILQGAQYYLRENGAIYLEIGYLQHKAIEHLAGSYGYIVIAAYKDLAGHVRALKLTTGI